MEYVRGVELILVIPPPPPPGGKISFLDPSILHPRMSLILRYISNRFA